MTTEATETPLLEDFGSRQNISMSHTHSQSEFLACALCSQLYVKPKLLPCLHTFCKHCIDSYTPSQSLSVTCPVCRDQSILPPDGVESIHDNTYVAQMTAFVTQQEHSATCSAENSASCQLHDGCTNMKLLPLQLVRLAAFRFRFFWSWVGFEYSDKNQLSCVLNERLFTSGFPSSLFCHCSFSIRIDY
jgi:RING-type zinc-finger